MPLRKVTELRKRMRPVIRFAMGPGGLFRHVDGWLHYIKPIEHPANYSYYIKPVPDKKCGEFKFVAEILTYHKDSMFLFSPSEAEVLAQIPEGFLAEVTAYEILSHERAMEEDYSVGTVRLYKS